MDLLIITATNAAGEAVQGVGFEVTANGTPLAVDDLGGVSLPESPRPLRIEIAVRPPPQEFFPLQGSFDYNGPGDLQPVEGNAKEFAPVRGVADALGNAVMSLLVFVSRVRDVTEKVLALLQDVPQERKAKLAAITPVTDLEVEPTRVSVVVEPPIVRNGDLQFVQPDLVSPEAEVDVFEVQVEPAPKLIAVVWPNALERTDAAPPTPLLVYFHPNAGQNRDKFYKGEYPFSFDFMFFGIVTYIRYARGKDGAPDPDPLNDIRGLKGLAHQIEAAEKDVVLVLPVNRLNSEVGVFLKAESMEAILKEIIAFKFRQKGVYRAAEIGRTALASFSAGNTLVTKFLQDNVGSPFAREKLAEVYNFDLPVGFVTGDAEMSAWTKAVLAWAATGNSADKRIRAYTQFNFATFYQQILGVAPPTAAPYEVSNAAGTRTAVVVPPDAWARISAQVPKPNGDFQIVHQMIADLLLTDALRRSGF